MKIKLFLARLFFGHAEIDKVNAFEKVWRSNVKAGEIIKLTPDRKSVV